MITIHDLESIDSNGYGNPRYVMHWCSVSSEVCKSNDIMQKYNEVLDFCKPLGGKKYHNKKYGGGIAFTTYNLQSLCDKINAALASLEGDK